MGLPFESVITSMGRKYCLSSCAGVQWLHIIPRWFNLGGHWVFLLDCLLPLGLMPLLPRSVANHHWQHQQRPRQWSTGALLCRDVLWKTILWNAVISVYSLSVSGLSLKWYRKAAPLFFLAESTPLHTLETLLLVVSSLAPKSKEKLCQENTFVWAMDKGSWYSSCSLDCQAGRGRGSR